MSNQPENIDDNRLLLAIESSLKASSVALFRNAICLGEAICESDSAKNLFPLTDQLLKNHEVSGSDLDFVAVAKGPGSFTGLRIGITMAKTLAYSGHAKLIAIPTTELLAFQALDAAKEFGRTAIDVVLDAQRGQLFYARFQTANLTETVDTRIIDREQLVDLTADNCLVTGPGLLKQNILPTVISSKETWLPRASSLGQRGLDRIESESFADVWSLVPNYGRKSAAEEKADL